MQMTSKKTVLAITLLLLVALIAGCGGGSGAKRLSGLTPEAVVQNFVDAAKANKLNEAALYVSQDSVNDTKVVIKYVTGQSDIEQLKNANLLSLRKVAQQGDYAVVVATLQQANSLSITVKPVGLTRVDGEWYIVAFEKIRDDLKYQALKQLISKF